MDEINTLDDLIERKAKHITIIGVFCALTLFSINLDIPLITFSSLAILIILCWVFYRGIPQKDDSSTFFSTLKLFELLFFFGILVPIYLYVAKYAFSLHPDQKILFIIYLIVPLHFNFNYFIVDNWMKNPKTLPPVDSQRYYRVIIVTLMMIISLEMTYITIKLLEIWFK